MNKIEQWKQQKHGFDVWPDLLQYAEQRTPMSQIDNADLERLKWHGVFYRKRDAPESYMLRIRLPGCQLTDKQAKEIAYIAYEFGHGIADVTTRANIQVQGLPVEHVPKAMSRLERVGLSAKQTGHDNIRNVFCHPLSGVDPHELIDTRQLCQDITDLFVGSRMYSDLPRKFNIAVCGREAHGLHYWSQDISFLAYRAPHGDVMFQMLVGGTQGQHPRLPWHLPVLVAPGQAVDVTRALLDLFREQGSREKRDRARFRYLIERIGVAGVLQWLEDHLDYPLMPHAAEPQPPTGYDELVGWFPEHDAKRLVMGLCVPLGRLTWRQLEGLGALARRWGDGGLRTTHEQGVIVTGVPIGFKDAAATQAAGLGLSPQADTLSLNTVACTGKQFCNIAVTETKGHMFRLIEKLRQRALALHGVRIHMSGCPSSCAQHFTADIGLKGVRVRRLLGTREGFDIYLGGGVAGQVHLGLLYRLGVDVDQLPNLIEEVIREYYLKHRAGETFSAYWRGVLCAAEAAKVSDGEYSPPTWICDGCQHEHWGEDPPVFCPSCAGLRRLFARLETTEDTDAPKADHAETPPRADGFVFAAKVSDLSAGEGLSVEIAGRDYALFRVDGEVVALDGACPHEGAPLAQGTLDGCVLTCPWHGWTFNARTGFGVEPQGHELMRYETKIEDGAIYLNVGRSTAAENPPSAKQNAPAAPRPKTASLAVVEIIQETHDVKTFRLENSDGAIPAHLSGQFVRASLAIDGEEIVRNFTISSSPSRPDRLDLTVKRNPGGLFSNALHDTISPGDRISIHGPQGGFFFHRHQHTERLVLISAGSGVTPMMSIARYLADEGLDLPCTFVHGARTPADIMFGAECETLARKQPNFTYHLTLSQPTDGWTGRGGRIDAAWLLELAPPPHQNRYFLCGPGAFMDGLRNALIEAGADAARIHTEAFHPAGGAAPRHSPSTQQCVEPV